MPLFVAEGPADYLGGSVETFALPFAAFIVVACMLFLVFRRPHSVSQLPYSSRKQQASVRTAEPGEISAPPAGGGKHEGPVKPPDSGPGTATGVSMPEGKK